MIIFSMWTRASWRATVSNYGAMLENPGTDPRLTFWLRVRFRMSTPLGGYCLCAAVGVDWSMAGPVDYAKITSIKCTGEFRDTDPRAGEVDIWR